MRSCVHCAEEIQDEAAVCKHCGRAVPTGATKISHRAGSFGIGPMDEAYGVWDLQHGGPPLAQFDKSEDGWAQAWTRFQQASVQIASAPPTNGKAVASMVLGIVWMWGITSIIGLILGYIARKEIKASGGRQGGDGMAIAGIVLGWVGIGLLIFALLAISFVTSSHDYDYF